MVGNLTNRSSSLAPLAGTIPRMRVRDFRMQAIAPYRGVEAVEKPQNST